MSGEKEQERRREGKGQGERDGKDKEGTEEEVGKERRILLPGYPPEAVRQYNKQSDVHVCKLYECARIAAKYFSHPISVSLSPLAKEPAKVPANMCPGKPRFSKL